MSSPVSPFRSPTTAKLAWSVPTGSVKTTLLLILAGETRPSDGHVSVSKGTRIGYLPQEASRAFTTSAETVYDEMLALFADLREQEAALTEMAASLADRPDDPDLLSRYSQSQDAFEAAGGYDYEIRIQAKS